MESALLNVCVNDDVATVPVLNCNIDAKHLDEGQVVDKLILLH